MRPAGVDQEPVLWLTLHVVVDVHHKQNSNVSCPQLDKLVVTRKLYGYALHYHKSEKHLLRKADQPDDVLQSKSHIIQ